MAGRYLGPKVISLFAENSSETAILFVEVVTSIVSK
jgi:hypothetical protein